MVLQMPTANEKFHLESDSEQDSCTAALFQLQQGKWLLIWAPHKEAIISSSK